MGISSGTLGVGKQAYHAENQRYPDSMDVMVATHSCPQGIGGHVEACSNLAQQIEAGTLLSQHGELW